MPLVWLVGCETQAAQAAFDAEVHVCGVMPSKNGSRSSSARNARSAALPSTGPSGDHPTTKRFTTDQSLAKMGDVSSDAVVLERMFRGMGLFYGGCASVS